MNAPLVDVRAISKHFGSLVVIEDLSFCLHEGEALGIVGPNGAGKTTTLNVIAGDFAPSNGSIHFAGVDVTGLGSNLRCRRGISRTAQIPRPFDGLTVFENTMTGAVFGAALRGQRAVDAAADALRRAGLLQLANVRVGKLRLLERKRLELARALATQPRVLLLDEIAGGLTDAEVQDLIETIRTLRADGVSIIWIEHIVHALLQVVDRIMAMDYGRKLIEGDPHEVMASEEVRSVYLGVAS